MKRKAKKYPDDELLNKLFSYDIGTGLLYNRENRGPHSFKNQVVGCRNPEYLVITIKNKQHLVHRIIWIMVHGSINRDMEIDHINGIGLDNRLSNLRLVSHRENDMNSKVHKNNISGCMGVGWCKREKSWRARIQKDGKELVLGYFKNKEDAIRVRKEAEVKYGYHKNHGRGK